MYLVKFKNNDIVEFNAVDFEDLMLLIVNYIGEDKELFRKMIVGFEEDIERESQYLKLYNKFFSHYDDTTIVKIYEINDGCIYYQC